MTRRLILLAATGTLAFALALAASPSPASTPDPPSSASASPPPFTLAPHAPVPSHSLFLPARGSLIPTTVSPAPKQAEWEDSRSVGLTRGRDSSCTFELVREWLRVRCPGTPGAGLVAGDAKGVTVRVVQENKPNGEMGETWATIVLPVRRGETHVFTLNELLEEYNSDVLGPGSTLIVAWRNGSPDPFLALYGAPTPTPPVTAPLPPE